MKAFRILLHGLVLLSANIAGICIGFLIYDAMRPANQIAVQGSIAAISSILLFVTWTLVLSYLHFNRLRLQSTAENLLAFITSLMWGPFVFVPLHYFTQGYLTSADNIIALFVFQVPVNAVAMFLAWKANNPALRQMQ